MIVYQERADDLLVIDARHEASKRIGSLPYRCSASSTRKSSAALDPRPRSSDSSGPSTSRQYSRWSAVCYAVNDTDIHHESGPGLPSLPGIIAMCSYSRSCGFYICQVVKAPARPFTEYRKGLWT
jgi:hypothetical protein